MQSYIAPIGGATPSLPTLIEQLQNIHLLSQDVPAGHYALHRSIGDLTLGVAGVIAQADAQLLEAITPTPAASCQ